LVRGGNGDAFRAIMVEGARCARITDGVMARLGLADGV